MNEGGWDDLYNIIIEPCTVCYDRPDVAKKYGQESRVEALGTYKWHIEIEHINFKLKKDVEKRCLEKKCLVTGSGTGLGREIALEFGRQGAAVALSLCT